MLQTLDQIEADVICLQECQLFSQKSSSLFSKHWPHGPAMFSGSEDIRTAGVAILKKGDTVCLLQHKKIVAGRQ